MKKSFPAPALLFVAILFMFDAVEAQVKKPGFILAGNFVYSNPKGSFANGYSTGVGAEIAGGIGLGKTYLLVSTGYSYFLGKGDNENMPVKPFKVGLRQYLFSKKLFVNADIGRATIKDKIKGTNEVHNLRGLGAGARLLGLEAAINYEGWDHAGSNGFSNSLQYKVGWNIML
ncbi:MAG: hypothetical protein LH478_01200 [Chitinophagaceae bacterium]|nr:hypothetical protein [Chitinophagaceae bacterium]